jgi:hypothetical protein
MACFISDDISYFPGNIPRKGGISFAPPGRLFAAARGSQSEEDRFVDAGIASHHFAQPACQVVIVVTPEQVVAHVAAERTSVVGGFSEDVGDAGAARGDRVERAPRQVRIPLEHVRRRRSGGVRDSQLNGPGRRRLESRRALQDFFVNEYGVMWIERPDNMIDD